MLLVKTKLGNSPIAGIGLFADESITKGTKLWQYEPKLDLLLSKAEVETLSEPAQEQFYKYAYLDRERNRYLLCGDDARFWNHSENPNCDETTDNDSTFAARDIEKGEELTIRYSDFYGNMDEHPEIVNRSNTSSLY
jgi:SET domain-containing protein